jgi:hypothetical protein
MPLISDELFNAFIYIVRSSVSGINVVIERLDPSRKHRCWWSKYEKSRVKSSVVYRPARVIWGCIAVHGAKIIVELLCGSIVLFQTASA